METKLVEKMVFHLSFRNSTNLCPNHSSTLEYGTLASSSTRSFEFSSQDFLKPLISTRKFEFSSSSIHDQIVTHNQIDQIFYFLFRSLSHNGLSLTNPLYIKAINMCVNFLLKPNPNKKLLTH